MPTLLNIDNDTSSRRAIQYAAPEEWTVLEAANGLIGLDFIRHYGAGLDLIVIDPQLPDLEGRLICAQIRMLFPSVPILPVTEIASALPLLAELGCLPPLMKPILHDDLTERLRSAVTKTPSLPIRSAMLHLIYEQAVAEERRVRQALCQLRVLVYAASPIKRAGLAQLLGAIGLVDEVEQPGALRRALAQARYHALVTVAGDSDSVLTTANSYALPIIVIAPTFAHGLSLQTAQVAGIVLENDPAAAVHLQHMLAAIKAGDPHIGPDYASSPLWNVPPAIVRRFAHTHLTRRELETVWLDAQGWSSDQIARHLSIERTTVNSHWKRIQRKLNLSREGVRSWVHAHLQSEDTPDQLESREASL